MPTHRKQPGSRTAKDRAFFPLAPRSRKRAGVRGHVVPDSSSQPSPRRTEEKGPEFFVTRRSNAPAAPALADLARSLERFRHTRDRSRWPCSREVVHRLKIEPPCLSPVLLNSPVGFLVIVRQFDLFEPAPRRGLDTTSAEMRDERSQLSRRFREAEDVRSACHAESTPHPEYRVVLGMSGGARKSTSQAAPWARSLPRT